MLPEHIREAIYELADTVANPTGYADDPIEADRRGLKRDSMVAAITTLVYKFNECPPDHDPSAWAVGYGVPLKNPHLS